MNFQISHPHAQTAVLLASFNYPERADVNRELRTAGCPRSLYTLARVLRAAQIMDEIDHADRQMKHLRQLLDEKRERDAAAIRERFAPAKTPAIRYDANAFGPGLAGILVDHEKAA